MKTSNKSTLFTGVILLILAAFFSISLILVPLDFGVTGPGHNNILYVLGKILYTAYGFSSVLVPIFLLVSGLSCFASKWTARRTLRLLTALVPFFTCVVTEKICRSILALKNSPFASVKIAVALITGAMLLIIEYLGSGILADKMNRMPFSQKLNKKFSSQNEKEKNVEVYDDELDSVEVNAYEPVETFNGEEVSSLENSNESSDLENADATEVSAVSAKATVFDEVLDSVTIHDYDSNDDEYCDEDFTVEDSEVEDEPIGEMEEIESETENKVEENSVTEKIEPQKNFDEKKNFAEEKDSSENDAESESENSTSVITQEEFAALTSLQDDSETDENADVLEWKNLPPEPATLPPEYDEDFDENDPALEFPPKDEKYEDEHNHQKNKNVEAEKIVQDAQEDLQIENAPSFIEEPEFVEEDDLLSPIIDEIEDELSSGHSAQEFEEDFEEQNSSVQNQKKFSNEDEPVLEKKTHNSHHAKYSDSVVLNPNYPHGITIHDGEENSPEEENSQEKQTEKPKFPARIQLQSTPEEEADETDDYEEDVTLPFPKFDLEEPAVRYIHNEAEENFADEEIFSSTDDSDETEDADEDAENVFEDEIVYTDESENEDIENSFEDSPEEDSVQETPARQKLQSVKKSGTAGGLGFVASDVFSEMEDDIRKEQEIKNEETDDSDDDVEIDLTSGNSSNSSEKHLQEKRNSGNAGANPNLNEGATNLTKDELTDFFNAQQAENTPKTTEIMGNPVQVGNRAVKKGPYVIPSDLLIAYKDDEYWIIDDATKQAAMSLKQTLAEFNIEAEIIGIKKGPVVTMFEILPAPGVKLSKIVALQDNIALSLAAQSVRIVAPIPGKQAVGIEVPNKHRSVVGFREIIEMDLPEWQKMAVPVVLGKDILGKAQLIDLVKTPHMLIAGATGSGKSVCVNSLILSILYKRSFRDVKLILVDPKVVELKLYNNIPHLLTPVITEPKKALQALQYCLCEMERRYALLDGMGVRDISNYNQKIREQNIATEKLPYIVVIIDEFADLMATSGKELETIVARLTAMSRAVGIHLVLATQRPSVNVITGLIKANIPTRIAFMVASRTDSNIIIDTVGAEKLLGRGDMLYASAVDPAPIRIQGTFVTDQEVEDVVNAVKEYGEPDYIDDEIFVDDEDEDGARDLFGEPMDDDDPLYDQALEIVVQSGKASASYIQRRLKIGYNRAARLVEEMEERGIVGPANGSKPREIIHIP